MRFTLLIILILPIYLYGQNVSNRVDSVLKFGLGDTTLRKVYFSTEEMPKLLDGNPIVSYLGKQSLTVNSCCAFRAYIGFVVEADSSVTNKMVYVRTVNCEESGLLYDGPEIKAMELRIKEIIDEIPRLIPGKMNGKNVAVKIFLPVHVDCFMR
jgi:hypothetical protein